MSDFEFAFTASSAILYSSEQQVNESDKYNGALCRDTRPHKAQDTIKKGEPGVCTSLFTMTSRAGHWCLQEALRPSSSDSVSADCTPRSIALTMEIENTMETPLISVLVFCTWEDLAKC